MATKKKTETSSRPRDKFKALLKKGIGTSEWWALLGSAVLTAVGVMNPIGLIPAGLYAVSRVMSKLGKRKAPGPKTTEFWAMIAGEIIVLVNTHFGAHIPVETVTEIASVFLLGAYKLYRGYVKSKDKED